MYSARKQAFVKGDPIQYGENYYIVTDIKYESISKLPEVIEIGPIIISKKVEDNIKQWISPNDKHVRVIDKKLHESTIGYVRFVGRYNNTIYYLKKKKPNALFIIISNKNIEDDINILFEKCKLSMKHLNKIENTLKKTQSTLLQIKNITKNPFDFITEEYQLFTFDKADKICDLFKLDIPFEQKSLAWSYDLFIRQNNSFYIERWKYLADYAKFCITKRKDKSLYLPYIEKVIINKTIDGKVYKTTEYLLEKERDITDLTMKMFYDEKYDFSIEEINEEIKEYEKERGKLLDKKFVLEQEQKESVIKSLTNKLSIITGPPGTGKTEIIRCINAILYNLTKKEYPEGDIDLEQNKFVSPQSISLLAPTGLAFINMKNGLVRKTTETKGEGKEEFYNDKISGTCHRVIYHTFENIKRHSECKCLDNCKCFDICTCCKYIHECTCSIEIGYCQYDYTIKLIIVDEASMIDIFMFHEILKMCHHFDSRLILVGDIRQLQSIGPGKVLKSLIESKCFDVTTLNTIKRQEAGTLVVCIKNMANDIIIDSRSFIPTDKSLKFIDIKPFILQNREINKELLFKLINEYDFDKKFTKFITYFNKETYTFNTTALNNILQDKYNPRDEESENDEIPSNLSYYNYTFRVEDRIVRTENDYSSDKMRANGEEAEIIEFDGKYVTIRYKDEKETEQIGINELYDNFILNYSINIHKSQGSQYTNVVFFIEPNQSFIISKSSVYTAISRAKERCIIISNMEDFIECQKNTKNDEKKVSLFMRESNSYEL
jgi:exodeoxyribonuclease V alpha subunit